MKAVRSAPIRDGNATSQPGLPIVVSLFSGAGGLDLGFKNAGYDIAVALDIAAAAVETHSANFPETNAYLGDIVALGPGGVLQLVSGSIPPGSRIGVIGGPPCQGFSRANTKASAADPRNRLAIAYLDAIAALNEHYELAFVVFENVPGIRDRRNSKVLADILGRFEELGLFTEVTEYRATDFGVPQERRRILISGLKTEFAIAKCLADNRSAEALTVRDAIGGLPEPVYYSRGLDTSQIVPHPNHWTMQPRSARFSSPEKWRGSGRSFRRLVWDAPSPTVAYGHREIHVHPDGHRRLSIYEAMLLQGFPPEFQIHGNLSQQVEQVSNAVPPPLGQALASAIASALNA